MIRLSSNYYKHVNFIVIKDDPVLCQDTREYVDVDSKLFVKCSLSSNGELSGLSN